MHNYILWRTLGAALASSGVAAVVAAFALPPPASNHLRAALAVYGFGALIFGGVGALWAQTRMRVEAAEASGGDMEAAATGDPRWRGGGLVVLGVILIAIMVALITTTEPMLLYPGRSYGGTRFTGTATEGLALLALFAGLLIFGVAAVVYGAWQIKTGRQDKRVMMVAGVLWGMVVALVAML